MSTLREVSNNTFTASQGGAAGLKNRRASGAPLMPPPPPSSSSAATYAPGAGALDGGVVRGCGGNGAPGGSPRADARHAADAVYCTNLIADITDTFHERESRAVRAFNAGTAAHTSDTGSLYAYYASPHYLQYQPEINEKMRMILIDWLMDVHIKFKLHPETFFLAVNLTDRYLSCVNTKHNPRTYVPRAQIQLVGITATLIAAKYEEIWPPEVKECVHIAANTYTRDEVIAMERAICAALAFRLTVPTSLQFAQRLWTVLEGSAGALAALLLPGPAPGSVSVSGSPAGPGPSEAELATQLQFASRFFMEHAALDYKCLQFTPSQVANASVALAIATLRLRYGGANTSSSAAAVWTPLLQHYSRAAPADFKGCAEVILEYVNFVPTTKYQAVRRKYSSSRYGEIAKMMMPTDAAFLA